MVVAGAGKAQCIKANGLVFVSGLPPFDPDSGEFKRAPFERQWELVLNQLRHCLETAGASFANVLKCNVYCAPGPTHFATFNSVCDRYFSKDAPSRIFMYIHACRARSTSRSIAWRSCKRRYGRIANARAGKPRPSRTFGQVTTISAPVAGTLSRLAMTSI